MKARSESAECTKIEASVTPMSAPIAKPDDGLLQVEKAAADEVEEQRRLRVALHRLAERVGDVPDVRQLEVARLDEAEGRVVDVLEARAQEVLEAPRVAEEPLEGLPDEARR